MSLMQEELNEIVNVVHKRLFNLEIALQANNPIFNRSYNQFAQELGNNAIEVGSTRNSVIVDQLNLSSPGSLKRNVNSSQTKTRAYEFAAIFEDAFDQMNIIHTSLSTHHRLDTMDSNSNSDCNPMALSLAGIFIMNEEEKFRYEMEHFNRLLMLFFRALLLDSDTPVNPTPNHLSSKALLDLQNRLKASQDQISKLSFIKKHFHNEKSIELNRLDSSNAQLKDHLMEEKSRSKIALRYCNDWKQNHILQWIQMLLQIERDYTKTIQQYELDLKQAKIGHEETIRALTEQRDQMKSNANQRYEHYQNETTRFEKELTDFRSEFNQINRQRQEMAEEYHRMNTIVEEYHQMQINERLIVEKQKREGEAIRRIQAWWRGTMVRHLKHRKKKSRGKNKHSK